MTIILSHNLIDCKNIFSNSILFGYNPNIYKNKVLKIECKKWYTFVDDDFELVTSMLVFL